MTKKLNVDQITSELEGSAFFRDARQRHTQASVPTETSDDSVIDRDAPAEMPAPPVQIPRRPQKEPARSDGTMPASYQDTKLSSYQASHIDDIRRTVKDSGKEASILRVSSGEKEALSETVYQCKRSGFKTTETQLVRIAIAALLQEYEAHQDASILVRVLQALKE